MNELVAGESNVVDIYTLLQAASPWPGRPSSRTSTPCSR